MSLRTRQDELFLGVDVGTRSARAGLFDAGGNLIANAATPITLHQDEPDLAEYASEEIWRACGTAIRAALSEAQANADAVKAIGFDATCSLVVVGAKGKFLSISPTGATGRDTICWMDHRALREAADINKTGHMVLERVGGTISPEMQLPKILWLARHLPDVFAQADAFFDLPDWLTFKATGETARSLCSTVCKWTYLGERGCAGEGWAPDFFQAIGLEALMANHARSIGNRMAGPGQRVGLLTEAAAADLGLKPGIPVAAGSIDAHAGAIGTLGSGGDTIVGRIAIIAGTSACHIAISGEPVEAPGVWGPYHSVVLPRLWALEGGQSAAGALVDRLVNAHPAANALRDQAEREGTTIFEMLEAALEEMSGGAPIQSDLAADLHVQPDFLGNRSPLAEPERKGAVVGLTLDQGVTDLARLYLASLQALAYGSRHIVQAMAESGHAAQQLVLSGGLARNALFLRELADSTGLEVIVPLSPEPVLLGGAILGATAAGKFASLDEAMHGMTGNAEVIRPTGESRPFHDRKYAVYRRMQDDFAAYRRIMQDKGGAI